MTPYGLVGVALGAVVLGWALATISIRMGRRL